MDENGTLRGVKEKSICIGQGFRGKEGEIGVGNCTRLFRTSVRGCPPSASSIRDMLESM